MTLSAQDENVVLQVFDAFQQEHRITLTKEQCAQLHEELEGVAQEHHAKREEEPADDESSEEHEDELPPAGEEYPKD